MVAVPHGHRGPRGGLASPGTPRGRRRRATLIAWGFALPFTLVFLTFTLGPLLMSVLMAFTDISIKELRNPTAVDLVGVDNFLAVLTDPLFVRSLLNTLYFVGVGVPLTLLIALAVASVMNVGVTWLRAQFRVAYYLPVVTNTVAIAVVWRFLFRDESGPINEMLGWLGVDGPNWLADPVWAMPAMIIMAVWRNLGTIIIILLAGLQSVPRELHEAAAMDGAGGWRRFLNVSLPGIRPATVFCAVLLTIGFMQFFEEPFVMTRGGPLDSTMSVAYYIYNQFGFGKYGIAAAASYVLLALTLVFTAVQIRVIGARRTEKRDVRRARATRSGVRHA